MVIVSTARKDCTNLAQRSGYHFHKVSKLIDYINREDCGDIGIYPEPLTHDAPATTKDLFAENIGLLKMRKDGNILYHEYISFAASDTEHLTPEVLQDIANAYQQLRAPHALCYAKAHRNAHCVHIHFAFTANNRGETKRIRLSTAQFASIKNQMEQYQRKKYPQLANSHVDHQPKRERVQKTRSETTVEKRTKQPSQKQRVRDLVADCMAKASTREGLLQLFNDHELELYQRGRHHGVKDASSGKKYRFHTLGLVDTFAAARQRWEENTIDRASLDTLEQVEALEQHQGDLVSVEEAPSKDSDDEIVLEHGINLVGRHHSEQVEVGEGDSSQQEIEVVAPSPTEILTEEQFFVVLRQVKSRMRNAVEQLLDWSRSNDRWDRLRRRVRSGMRRKRRRIERMLHK